RPRWRSKGGCCGRWWRPRPRPPSRARSCAASGELGDRLTRHIGIVEGMSHAGDDLAALMAFAREQEQIARSEQSEAAANRGGAVADLLGAGAGREDGMANRRRILAAGIVVG